MTELVDSLSLLGLQEYEAKAYVALVGLGAATARQVHEASGVPRPRVYDILSNLSAKGFVEVRHGSPTYYKAIEPTQMISKLREDFNLQAERSLMELENINLESARKVSPLWYLEGEWSIQKRSEDLISRTKKQMVIACANEKVARPLLPVLRKTAEKRKVTCIVLEGADELRGKTGKAELRKPIVTKDALGDVLLVRLLVEDVELDGTRYELQYSLMVDSREGMLYFRMNKEPAAIWIKLRFITYLQSVYLDRIMESSSVVE